MFEDVELVVFRNDLDLWVAVPKCPNLNIQWSGGTSVWARRARAAGLDPGHWLGFVGASKCHDCRDWTALNGRVIDIWRSSRLYKEQFPDRVTKAVADATMPYGDNDLKALAEFKVLLKEGRI